MGLPTCTSRPTGCSTNIRINVSGRRWSTVNSWSPEVGRHQLLFAAACDSPPIVAHMGLVSSEGTRVDQHAHEGGTGCRESSWRQAGQAFEARAARVIGKLGSASLRAAASARDEGVRWAIEPLYGQGLTLRAIAATLNERKVLPARGDTWHASSVGNVVRRLELSRE